MDSMANQRNGSNHSNNANRTREAPWRAKLAKFQRSIEQSIVQLQQELQVYNNQRANCRECSLECLQATTSAPVQDNGTDGAQDDNGIQVHPIHHHIPTPISRPPVHEENFNDNEDFTEVVFKRNGGLG